MKKTYFKNVNILAITPCARGIGFASLEGHSKLLDWGVKSGKGDKNKVAIANVKELISRNQPEVIVLQEMKDAKRDPRIKVLNGRIAELGKSRGVNVALITDDEVKRAFFTEGEGTRHVLAETVAKRFPNELGMLLPPKRKAWNSEDSRIDFFYAVALALTLKLKT